MVQNCLAVGILILSTVAAPPTAIMGAVDVSGPEKPEVVLVTAEGREALTGELTQELARLRRATVEILGLRVAPRFLVQGYRILEVQGEKRPWVGTLFSSGHGLVLVDGMAPGIDLSAAPEMQAALSGEVGARLWLAGDRLLSGQIRVRRYGVLRPATGR